MIVEEPAGAVRPQGGLLGCHREIDELAVRQEAASGVVTLVAGSQERFLALRTVPSSVIDILPVHHDPRWQEADGLAQSLGYLEQTP